MKKYNKIINLLSMVFMFLFMLSNSIYAADGWFSSDSGVVGIGSSTSSSSSGGIAGAFEKIGRSIHSLVTNENSLYGIYFIVFLMGIYALTNKLLQNVDQFRGKAAKTISLMVSIITTGAIFYGPMASGGPRSAKDLINLFNGFGGFIFILVFAIGVIAGTIYLFKKTKEKNMNLAMLYLVIGLFLASSLLLPQFLAPHTDSSGTSVYDGDSKPGGYIGERQIGSFSIFGTILLGIRDLSYIAMLVYLVINVSVLFKKEDADTISNKNAKPDKKVKDIGDIKRLLGKIYDELKKSNDHFNNKVNILNKIRRDVGNVRTNNRRNP